MACSVARLGAGGFNDITGSFVDFSFHVQSQGEVENCS